VVHRQHVTSLIIEVTRLMTKPPTQLDLEEWAGSTQYSIPIGWGRGSRSSEHWAPEQQHSSSSLRTLRQSARQRVSTGGSTQKLTKVYVLSREHPPFTYIQL